MARKITQKESDPATGRLSKRTASDRPTPIRQSKRTKVRSSYFEHDSSEDDKKSSDGADIKVLDASDYEDDEETNELSPSEAEQDVADSEEEVKPRKAGRGKAAKGVTMPIHKKQADAKELWESGARLEPGTQLIIKKPKAREAGDTPYSEDTIHPNTMLFLKDLAANNDRQWLKRKFILMHSVSLHCFGLSRMLSCPRKSLRKYLREYPSCCAA
jgi:hypothetical protein